MDAWRRWRAGVGALLTAGWLVGCQHGIEPVELGSVVELSDGNTSLRVLSDQAVVTFEGLSVALGVGATATARRIDEAIEIERGLALYAVRISGAGVRLDPTPLLVDDHDCFEAAAAFHAGRYIVAGVCDPDFDGDAEIVAAPLTSAGVVGAPIVVGDAALRETAPVFATSGTSLLMGWMERRNVPFTEQGGRIFARRLDADGALALGPVIEVAASPSGTRPTDLAVSDDGATALFAWSERAAPSAHGDVGPPRCPRRAPRRHAARDSAPMVCVARRAARAAPATARHAASPPARAATGSALRWRSIPSVGTARACAIPASAATVSRAAVHPIPPCPTARRAATRSCATASRCAPRVRVRSAPRSTAMTSIHAPSTRVPSQRLHPRR